MGQKLRNILSELATDLKARNYDDRISFRYLNSKFKSKIEYFLRLESKAREIFSNYSMWKKIKLVDLETSTTTFFGYVDLCNKYKISTIDIPELADTFYGKQIRVFSLDNSKEFKLISSVDYKDYINRKYMLNKNIFMFENNKIIIPNTSIDAVAVYIIPKNEIDVDKLNGDAKPCDGPLEGNIVYSDYLITLAKQEVLKELLGSYARVVEDEKGDDNNNNK